MAAGAGDTGFHRAVLCLEPALPLAQGTGADLGCSAVADRLPDVGWHFRLDLRGAGPLGRTTGDAGARDLRARLRLPARNPGGARTPLQNARDPVALRALCRADPRRSPDQSPVHGERDVSAVHA